LEDTTKKNRRIRNEKPTAQISGQRRDRTSKRKKLQEMGERRFWERYWSERQEKKQRGRRRGLRPRIWPPKVGKVSRGKEYGGKRSGAPRQGLKKKTPLVTKGPNFIKVFPMLTRLLRRFDESCKNHLRSLGLSVPSKKGTWTQHGLVLFRLQGLFRSITLALGAGRKTTDRNFWGPRETGGGKVWLVEDIKLYHW